jgi:YVTN family beta-propeller protein
LIRAIEPISIDTALANLLGPGDPFGNPLQGIPPSGLLSVEQNAFFVGPSLEQATISACRPHQMRQGIGHLLYAIDRDHARIVVFNSNTFDVVAQIATPDPTELAMGPNLDLLAVTNRAADTVTFIDIDPRSPTFHQIVATTPVEHHPVGIAWEPGNEDVLVCNEGSDSVSIISPVSLGVRKTVRRGLKEPFALAITQRKPWFGTVGNVYFAYILGRNGKVTLFESGPYSVNGWGYDDCIGQTSFTFREPKAIQPDPLNQPTAVWIAHEGQLDQSGMPTSLTGGAVTNLVVDGPVVGGLTFPPVPSMRGRTFRIQRSIGSDQLTGAPLDIAFDNLRNLGALAWVAPINGKSQVRNVNGTIKPTSAPHYMFLPVRDATGISRGVDVIDLNSSTRIDVNAFRPGPQSVAARGATIVADYFRQ